MAFALAHAVALNGALGHLIDVQADVSSGSANIALVGRADLALREGLDRIRMAIVNSDLKWPATYRTTILLSPADLPKSGTHFDLAMAATILAASGQVPTSQLDRSAFVGELTLSGTLRPAVGVLPMALAAAGRGIRRIFVPEPQVEEATIVPDLTVIGARSLAQVVAILRGDDLLPDAPPVVAASGANLISWRGDQRLEELDLADLRGMEDEKYAVEVAAAGGHAILLSGSKGAGKTSLAERIPTVLPDLTGEESLEVTAVHSLAGTLEPGQGMVVRPPYAAPHHDASKASVIGGGAGQVRPGAISRAHAGVLFMDEFPLFRSDVIEALRQPLESGDITVARRDESITLPAGGMLVLACNPCPCGGYATAPGANSCRCRETVRRDYRLKMSGPIADRIDITRHVLPARSASADPFAPAETSAQVRSRVAQARRRQQERFAECGWRLNSQIPSPRLKDDWRVSPEGQELLDRHTFGGRLSQRGTVRVLRLAWTVADLRAVRTGRDLTPGIEEVDVALRLRRGDPLDLRAVRGGFDVDDEDHDDEDHDDEDHDVEVVG